jgi:peptidoglycan/LPS O-acetylase OafA/YrhL
MLPGLDTVRAIGTFMVLTTHVAFWSGSYSFEFVGTVLSRLDVGVALFFVLSGFLLSRPYLARARRGSPPPGTRSYLWKRALRVLPVYWVVAVLALVFVAENAGIGPLGWLRALTLTDLYFSDRLPAGLTQMWSISTEIAFYLLLPMIMLGWNRVTRGRRSDLAVVGLTALSVLISAAWILGTGNLLGGTAPLYRLWLPTYLVWFVVGIALSHLHEHAGAATGPSGNGLLGWLPRLGNQPGVCWVIAAAVFLGASTVVAGPPLLAPATSSQLVTKTLLYAVIGGLVVLATAFADQDGVYLTVMSHPVLRHLGHISYGIFCVHILVLHFLSWATGWPSFTGHAWSLFVLTVVISVAAAELLHLALEKPLMRFRNWGASSASTNATRASGTTMSS